MLVDYQNARDRIVLLTNLVSMELAAFGPEFAQESKEYAVTSDKIISTFVGRISQIQDAPYQKSGPPSPSH